MIEGPALWTELHTTAVRACSEDWSNRRIDSFLDEWLAKVRAATVGTSCNCVGHFEAIMEAIPILYESFATWTWKVHNRVNSRLGKSTFTWRQFVRKWDYLGKKYESRSD